MSPEYPSPYSSNTICTYEFHGNDQERIRIVFLDFDVYCSGDNSDRYNYSDSVSVFIFVDGRLEKIDSYCGDKLPGPIMSNGPWMRIEFKGRRAQSKYRGFKATYSFTTDYAIRIGSQSQRYPCAFNFYSNETKYGYFHSPNFPGLYPRNTECHYFFYGILSEKVALHFSSFDIEGVSSCDAQTASDSVEISNYHGEDRKYTRYCGKLSEFDVESDSRFFRVTFRSNGRLDGTGFNATYYFLERIFTTKKFQEIPRNGEGL
ncbi:unnamed protein product [Phaedon cochleariae]|uniref:CUB domain-containing protein n=1 Tax=Phaedon cochleariae TaxID=80249 RepID=A0A9P0DSF6_PHACE|nr:unnamed protein product [Phaedon cochleariae]